MLCLVSRFQHRCHSMPHTQILRSTRRCHLLLLHAYLDLVYLRSEDEFWCAVQQL